MDYIQNMILVTGASGKTGKAITKALSKVDSICAFVHREEQVAVLKSLGAEKVIVGDLRHQVDIRSAMRGARAVYHICPNMSPSETVIGKSVIDEAKKAGVEHFVYHSVLRPQIEAMNHHWQKMRVEESLFESGLPFTILQPAPYMQNLLAGWKRAMGEGVLRVPYSVESKFSFVDLENVAEVARIVLTQPDHTNAIYELAGTMPTSHVEAAETFSQVLRRDVKAEIMTIEDWKLGIAGLSDYALENLVKMFEYYDRRGLMGNPNVLTWILRREPNSLESFAERVMKEHYAEN